MRGVIMHRTILAVSFWLCLIGQASALTVKWDCSQEADVQEYRVEYSADAGKSWGVEATVPHPKPCVSPVKVGITRYLAPGAKLFRVFSIDLEDNQSLPSQSVSYQVKPPLIGSTSGQVEAPIPPSPFSGVVTPPTPVYPTITLPPAPPIVRPPTVTLKQGLQSGLDTCLSRKLAHTACMKAISDALGKVTQ